MLVVIPDMTYGDAFPRGGWALILCVSSERAWHMGWQNYGGSEVH